MITRLHDCLIYTGYLNGENGRLKEDNKTRLVQTVSLPVDGYASAVRSPHSHQILFKLKRLMHPI